MHAARLQLDYQEHPGGIFQCIRHLPWAQLLDSCNADNPHARYDIMVADPVYTLIHQEQASRVYNRQQQLLQNHHDAFSLLETYLQKFEGLESDLPFCGGAMGYWGYDLLDISKLNDQRIDILNLPDMAIGIYEWAIVTDHKNRNTFLTGLDLNQLQSIKMLCDCQPNQAKARQALKVTNYKVDKDLNHYREDFSRIQKYLREGDCYQVNYARCFTANCEGDSWQSYVQLRELNPVPFAAYLQLPFADIISSSPERFIDITNKVITTSPIKGTRPRFKDKQSDEQSLNALKFSQKDRAENLMIVDLLRNDLGKSCVPGSIEVPALFDIERFPTVFHMVSTIKGQLKPEISPIQAFKNCFPGGSITGAPKKRAMQIIQELETYQRGIYCGSIGYISFNGHLDTNIAIRTMTVKDNQLCFWAGGGIVSDSIAEQEFQETNDKARAFFRLLGISEP